MGDPKKLRKQYSTPNHPWQKARIEEEKGLMKEFGLNTKKEVWKMVSTLKNYHAEAKRLVATHTKQAEIEKKNLLDKLSSLNLIKADAEIHDILNITIKDIFNRRLQTILVKKSLAKSAKQARQFITHGHVIVNDKKIDRPSYLVSEQELGTIQFKEKSALNNAEHPERVVIEKIENEKTKREAKE